MKLPTKVMYIIGLILNIIIGLGCIIATIIFGIIMNNKELLQEAVKTDTSGTLTMENIQAVYVALFVVFLILAIFSVIAVWVGVMGIKRANDDTERKHGFHITAIILGVLSGNIFYLLGGIFGLVNESEKANA